MAKYTPETICIASIYPGELQPIRRNYGPSRESAGKNAVRSTLFELKPVPRGKRPFVLEVMDSFEDVMDVVGSNALTARGEKPRLSKPVAAESIVEDLLTIWTGGLFNVPSGAKPGIMQIIGTIPTQAEMDQMKNQQTAYFEYLFTEGERLDKEKNWKEMTGTMKTAAEWLGYSRTWSNRAIAADSEPCPLCTAIIPSAAYVCPQCNKVIRALPPELAALQSTVAP